MNKRLSNILTGIFRIHESESIYDLSKHDIDSWDSLKQMDIVVTLEKEYGILLTVPDIVRMVSVAAIIEVLQEKGVNLGD